MEGAVQHLSMKLWGFSYHSLGAMYLWRRGEKYSL